MTTIHLTETTTVTPEQFIAGLTEGSERLHDDRDRVVITATDSSVWGGASGETYTFTRTPDGTTVVDLLVVREGKNLRGRLLAIVLGGVGTRAVAKALGETVRAIEARNQIPVVERRLLTRASTGASGGGSVDALSTSDQRRRP